jgi:hypothetical protein
LNYKFNKWQRTAKYDLNKSLFNRIKLKKVLLHIIVSSPTPKIIQIIIKIDENAFKMDLKGDSKLAM